MKSQKNDSFIRPRLLALIDGNEVEFQSNLELYRFAFIEKNRIDKFSHIGATTPGERLNRLAILFGLTEFSNFVNGFSDSIDSRIHLLDDQSKLLAEREKINSDNLKSINEKKEKLKSIEEKANGLITEINKPGLCSIDEAVEFLLASDGSGKIKDLEILFQNEKRPNYDGNFFTQIVPCYLAFELCFNTLCTAEEELIELSVNSSLVDVYKAVDKLPNEIDHTVCPVCLTPIKDSKENPFEYVKRKLSELNSFITLSTRIRESQKQLSIYAKQINSLVLTNESLLLALNINQELLPIPEFDEVSLYSKQDNKDVIRNAISNYHTIEKSIDDYKDKILALNRLADYENENNKYYLEARKLRCIHRTLLELQGTKRILVDEVRNKEKESRQYIEIDKPELVRRVEEEKQTNIRKQGFIDAYKRVVCNLTSYKKDLPIKLASSLSDKVKEYYNKMNLGDAEFELIDYLKMPVNESDNIDVQFKDGIKVNALQVLSEGHVKLLGLAILLAKAKETNQQFIILDDVVNAIDDDHRGGVAKLLFCDMDFCDIQIILTSHSEPFIKEIEDCIQRDRREKLITRYVFVTPFSEKFRGIVVDYSDPKEPLELAKHDLEKNSFKDAAQKCRQATESLVNKLWKKLAIKYNIQISVALRFPKGIPELSSVVDGIYKYLSKYKTEASDLLEIIDKLKSPYYWYLLNKGTHFEDNQFQFEGNSVNELYKLLVAFEKAINDLNIKAVATA